MDQSIIYALDFDGVICDSAIETGIAGWKAATRIWDDMPTTLPESDLIDKFRLVRPVIETGFESIAAIRLLFTGSSAESLLTEFQEKQQQLMQQYELDQNYFKQVFGSIRDQWIADSPDEWIQMNPLFPGVAEKLNRLVVRNNWYIVTTKQERFVAEILKANGIELPGERIFGLDRNMSKAEVLLVLQHNHPGQPIHFVEDRLPALLQIVQNDKLQSIKLFFADWGYNTRKDKIEAAQYGISRMGLEDFLA